MGIELVKILPLRNQWRRSLIKSQQHLLMGHQQKKRMKAIYFLIFLSILDQVSA
uniref:ATPANK2 (PANTOTHENATE KINASE 2) n=1 Tax=Arundo donax TaxID=35708 RepID=A0A0A9DWS3_ARUDO